MLVWCIFNCDEIECVFPAQKLLVNLSLYYHQIQDSIFLSACFHLFGTGFGIGWMWPH